MKSLFPRQWYNILILDKNRKQKVGVVMMLNTKGSNSLAHGNRLVGLSSNKVSVCASMRRGCREGERGGVLPVRPVLDGEQPCGHANNKVAV